MPPQSSDYLDSNAVFEFVRDTVLGRARRKHLSFRIIPSISRRRADLTRSTFKIVSQIVADFPARG